MVSEHRLRADICHAARVLYERGHNAPADGNVSARLGTRYLLCSPTGVHKGELTKSDIVKLRLADGESIDEKRPSSEIQMHLGIYRARADVRAIVHAHSPHAVGLTVSGQSMAEPVVPEAIVGLGGVPTVPYASPTTADVANAVLPYALRYNAFILERHGTVTLGPDVATALSRLEVVEHTAQITAVALSTGGASPIDPAEAAHLRKMGEDAGLLRPLGGASPVALDADEEALADALAERVLERLRRR
ncbi:MAG: class II aldolase/adducin family protein [Deltaproteobacteria bacterium]|nr:class II aldolase/adducin family protein [Deltaproteobacteria bacterium]